MDLFRKLYYITASSQFDFSTIWSDTKSNDVADAFSHLDFSKFFKLVPHADIAMTHSTRIDEWAQP